MQAIFDAEQLNVLFLPAGRALRARPAGPKITLLFPRMYIL